MPNTWGFGTDTTGFSSTVHDHILKEVVATLRAGLVSLPKGAVVPSQIIAQRGENFTLRATAYPDLVDTAYTDPLTEGTAPAALKLGIDTMDYTVTQGGARTVITDIAQLQSPHDLKKIAADKIAKLAADRFDKIAKTALLAGASDLGTGGTVLDSWMLLDAVSVLQARDVAPIPGVGYYAIMHPYALRGLLGETGLAGYMDIARDTDAGNFTKGAVGSYRGITFLVSTKYVTATTGTDGFYPIVILGKDSVAAGDVSSLTFHMFTEAGVGNELQQLAGIGFKSIFGAKVMAFGEVTDGAGTNGADVARAVKFTVTSGISGEIS